MSIRIVDFTMDHAEPLRAIYNEGIERVPHCYPVDADRFARALEPAAGAGKGPKYLSNERAWVAIKDQGPAGFIHVGDELMKEGRRRSAIRFLLNRPGERAAGQALLDRAHDDFPETDPIWAVFQHYRYDFYHRACAYLSDRLGHVQALLQKNGYTRGEGEIFFDWDNYDVSVDETPEGIEMRTEVKPADGRPPFVRVSGHRGDEEISACELFSCGAWTDEPSVQDRLFVKWLGVEREYQGNGLGKHTLLFALAKAKENGYRHASISTAVSNHRAFVFYSNVGFHVTDMTYGWARKSRKDLSESEE